MRVADTLCNPRAAAVSVVTNTPTTVFQILQFIPVFKYYLNTKYWRGPQHSYVLIRVRSLTSSLEKLLIAHHRLWNQLAYLHLQPHPIVSFKLTSFFGSSLSFAQLSPSVTSLPLFIHPKLNNRHFCNFFSAVDRWYCRTPRHIACFWGGKGQIFHFRRF